MQLFYLVPRRCIIQSTLGTLGAVHTHKPSCCLLVDAEGEASPDAVNGHSVTEVAAIFGEVTRGPGGNLVMFHTALSVKKRVSLSCKAAGDEWVGLGDTVKSISTNLFGKPRLDIKCIIDI